MKGRRKLLVLSIFIFMVGFLFLNKPIIKIIDVKANVYGAPVNSAFTDENFYKCVVDAYNEENKANLGYDVNLTDEQLESITVLSCKSSSINNTDGLGKLVNLTHLDLYENQITSIDLSKNTELTILNLTRNNLQSIDLSHNVSLFDLSLFGNQFATVDLSYNTELKYLSLGGENLQSIDLSHNTSLLSLSLSGSSITNIDLSHNTNLLDLKILNNDQLAGIDLSHNTMLVDLDLSDNSLTSIDLSKNEFLVNLNLGNSYSNGNHYTEDGNQFSSIDLSHNQRLKKLNIRDTQLSSIDLSENILLEDLDLSLNILTSIDLSHNTKLKYLRLMSNKLTDLDLRNNAKIDIISVNTLMSGGIYNYINYKGSDTYALEVVNEQDALKLPSNNSLTFKYIAHIYTADTHDQVNRIYSSGNYKVKIIYLFNESTIPIESNLQAFSIEATSDKYIIDEEDNYIYTGTDTDNETILENINLTEYNGVVGTIENNKYIVKYNDEVLKEFDLVNISSDMFDLSKDYLMGDYNTIINNINVNNGGISLNLVTNKIEIKHDDAVLKSFNYVNYTSNKYDLTKDYIKVNDDNIESFLVNINCTGCNAYVYDGTNNVTTGDFGENNKLRIIYSDQIIKEFNLKFSVSGVSLNTNELNLNLDSKKTFQLIADVMPLNAENKNITWESSDTSIASVDENGLVTAKSYGDAVITVKTEDGEFSDTCNVSVSEISTHTVTFKDGNDIYTDEFGENETIVFKTDLEKNGYKLVGWKFYDQVFSFDDKLSMPAVDIELEAVWELVIPEITNYITSDNNITNISFKTDMNNLNLGIDPMYEVKVSKHNGTDKTSGFIGTGDKVKIYLDSQLVSEYEVIIKGDINGDGNLSVSDISKLYKYLKKKMTMDDCYVNAGNVNGDNRISVSDVSKLYKVLKGKARL